jgi:hypothetical protein
MRAKHGGTPSWVWGDVVVASRTDNGADPE